MFNEWRFDGMPSWVVIEDMFNRDMDSDRHWVTQCLLSVSRVGKTDMFRYSLREYYYTVISEIKEVPV